MSTAPPAPVGMTGAIAARRMPLIRLVTSVISAPGRGLAVSIKAAACAGTSNAGVPPPKYSVSGRRVFFASSRSSAST